MTAAVERCPACNGLTYYVNQTGAHKCKTCKGTGHVGGPRHAWLQMPRRALPAVRR